MVVQLIPFGIDSLGRTWVHALALAEGAENIFLVFVIQGDGGQDWNTPPMSLDSVHCDCG